MSRFRLRLRLRSRLESLAASLARVAVRSGLVRRNTDAGAAERRYQRCDRDVRSLRATHKSRTSRQSGLTVEMRVAIAHCILLSRAEKLLQRVLADGLQQLLTAAVAQLHAQRLFHQSGGQVSHLRGVLLQRSSDAV
jgi:hypothetical protein